MLPCCACVSGDYSADMAAQQPTVKVLAGTESGGFQDGPPETARFREIRCVCRDSAGNFVVVDTGNHAIRAVDRKTGNACKHESVRHFDDVPRLQALSRP